MKRLWQPQRQLETKRRITIDPITRLEGHGKIEIFLNDEGQRGSRLLPGAGTARF